MDIHGTFPKELESRGVRYHLVTYCSLCPCYATGTVTDYSEPSLCSRLLAAKLTDLVGKKPALNVNAKRKDFNKPIN